MSHLDEGTLHALLDGELATTEVAEIQAHLGSCSACGLRLREVKEFFAEADRLIASVELGAQPVGATSPPTQHEAAAHPEPVARPDPARREPSVRPRPAAAGAAPREPWNEPPPMLLIPDNESVADRRKRRLQRASWAALIVGLVGAGFLGVRLRPQPAARAALARSAPAESSAVVSPEEASRPDGLAQSPESSALALSDKAAAVPKPSAPRPAPAAVAAREDGRAEAGRQLATGADAPAELGREEQSFDEQASDSAAELAAGANEESAGAEDIGAVRTRAAEALADLDRERRRDQAAAATAALDAERRRRAAAAPPAAAPTPPAPPTIEQRAGIYLRIGLDEASRQLGGPAHVIEGLSPMFMGLARGASVKEADATRPVVRVVYQDSQGRLILLDQQRVRAGQTPPPAGPLAWLIGGTAMWLNGEAGSEILRTYRPRVR